MTKKLLYKTSKAYVIYAFLIFVISAPLFYFLTEQLYIDDADETLMLQKREFEKYVVPQLTLNDIQKWNKLNRNLHIEPCLRVSKESFRYASYYDSLEKEIEPYRELKSYIFIQGKPFSFSARINLVEAEDLIENIALLYLVIISLFIIGLMIITKKMSKNLWKPFYETLNKIEKFQIDSSSHPTFSIATTEEFNRLNSSIEKLIEKNINIYKTQKEFIENAAHELQTPLAVFQAKIDTLMQSSEFTEEQFKTLGALTESVSRLNRLNKNLLLLSKIENDIYSEKQTIHLKGVIEKTFDFFSEQAKGKNLTILTELSEEVTIASNPILIDMLVSNLFLNAIKHNVNNGNITISVSSHSLCFSNSGQSQSLIPEKLFQRFSKSNPSEQGNGLGLAIVKKIADLNKWNVTYSFENQQHSFSVNFK